MTYDNYGNIKKKNGITYTYNNYSTWKDLLVTVGTQTISYDGGGNPTSYLGKELKWEKGRQLKKFGDYTFNYNKDGIRIEKFSSGTCHEYVLDGTNIIKETVSRASQGYVNEYFYDLDGSVCGIKHKGEVFYFYKNLQGDIIAITDSTGAVKATYTYDAWGKCTITSDTSSCNIATVNPFRYRGYYYDTDIDLYYLQSRYYDPVVGRFINADEVGYLGNGKILLGYNLYSYCVNDPINHQDRTGKIVGGISFEAQAACLVGIYATINIFFDSKSVLISFSFGGQLQYNASASVSVGIQVFPYLRDVSKTLGMGANFAVAWSWGTYWGAGPVFDVGTIQFGGSVSFGFSTSVFPVTFRFNVGYTRRICQYTYKELGQKRTSSVIILYVLGKRMLKMIKQNASEFIFEIIRNKKRVRYNFKRGMLSV